MSRRVQPGRQLTDVISAMPGGKAESILGVMATPRTVVNGRGGFRLLRKATLWQDDGGIRVCVVTVPFHQGEERSVTLKLGVCEEVFLADDSRTRKFSLEFAAGQDGELVVRIPPRLQPRRIHETACQILAAVLRGVEWVDRSGRTHKSPCGDHSAPPAKARAATS